MAQRALVELARSGDHEAFASLVRDAAVWLDGAARLILRDPESARDAVQDALIRAWRDLSGLRDPDRFDAWLHRLTVNACLDIARRRRRRAFEVEQAPAGVSVAVSSATAAAGLKPIAVIVASETPLLSSHRPWRGWRPSRPIAFGWRREILITIGW